MSVLVKLLAGLTVLAVMGTVTVTDPTGDSVGDGTIVAPTAPRYANSAIFDLQDVSLESRPGTPGGSIILLPAEGPGLPADVRSVLKVALGAIDVSESTALGFGSVVIDLYLDGAPGGREVTLDGPGMFLPAGRGWEYAVRLTPDGATGYRYVAPDESVGATVPVEELAEGSDGAGAADGVEAADGAELDSLTEPPLDFERVPVGVTLQGSTVTIEMPWDFPGEVVVYALTGVHDPFNPTGWRPLADAPSPWAYSGGEQVVPVVDLLAPDQEAQERALRTGVLPLPSVSARDAGTLWLVLMAVGLVVAAAGLVLRRRVPGAAKRPLRTGLPPATVIKTPTPVPQQVFAVPLAPADGETAEPQVREKVRQPDADVAAKPALSGVSAFDSYVLFEAASEEDEQDAQRFDELTQGAGVVPRPTVTAPLTSKQADEVQVTTASSDDST